MSKGKFGIHGGQFVPETLMNAVNEFEEAYNKYKNDPEFVEELNTLLRNTPQTVLALLCRKDDKGSRRSKNLLKARGLKPHRFTQN